MLLKISKKVKYEQQPLKRKKDQPNQEQSKREQRLLLHQPKVKIVCKCDDYHFLFL